MAKEVQQLSIIAAVAICSFLFFSFFQMNGGREGNNKNNLIFMSKIFEGRITGAVTAGTAALNIKTTDTSGTLQWKERNGKTVSLPLAADGSAVSGASETEAVFLSASAKNKPDEMVYLEGERCTGIATLSDCVGARFLAIQNKEAHLVRITGINTEKNEINIEDITSETESNHNLYTDGAATSLKLGDLIMTITINEAAMQITFTNIGSSNGAVIELYDKATGEIINTNTGSQTFEGIKFREYDDGALAAEKYIGQGGTAPLTIAVFYDDVYDRSLEISGQLLTDLTKAQGSGWYITEGTASFYTNKGTLILYDEKEKHSFTISHVAATASASVKIKKTAEQPASGWTIYGVDTEGDVGKASSFVLDKKGFVHISYFDETNDALKYAYETAEGWYVQTVDAGNVGRASDIALDSTGKPHIIYTDTKNNKLKYAMYDGKEWKRWTVEAAGAAAILPTLAFGANDEQYIAYYDYVADDLMLLFYNEKSQTWQQQTIDAEGDVGTEASIAVGSDNNPRIVYFDNTYDLLKYAWYDGTAWQKTVLDESGTAGLFTALTLDKNNYPTIWYYNQLQDKVESLQYIGSNKWEQKTFSLEGFDIWQGDILLDKNGLVHFSYYNQKEKDLRYAVGVWEE